MDDYEFLILFYCLDDGDAGVFGPQGELTRSTYHKYQKASGDNCLGHVHPESPLQPLIAAIQAGGDLYQAAIDVLLADRELLEGYLARLHDVAVLEA